MTEQLRREIVHDILDSFDFDKVHDVMKSMNWEWMIDEEMQVPSHYRLVKEAERLLYDVLKHDNEDSWVVETGGFTAFWYKGSVTLSFQIEESETDIEYYEQSS